MNEIISKIQKLLRLGSSSNESESNLAMQKALQLAMEHNLSIDYIRAQSLEEKKEEIVDGRVDTGKRKCVAQKFTSWVINKYFSCSIVYTWKSICFIGAKSDVEMAIYVQSFLNDEFLRLWKRFKNETGAPVKDRSSYIYGLYKGLCEKLEEQKQRTESQKFAEYNQSLGEVEAQKIKSQYALIIRSKQDRIEGKKNELFPRLTKTRTTTVNRNPNALNAGVAQGRNININRPIHGGFALTNN